jgi:hypothetical protein
LIAFSIGRDFVGIQTVTRAHVTRAVLAFPAFSFGEIAALKNHRLVESGQTGICDHHLVIEESKCDRRAPIDVGADVVGRAIHFCKRGIQAKSLFDTLVRVGVSRIKVGIVAFRARHQTARAVRGSFLKQHQTDSNASERLE